jgi:predicted  nucleic acid-binding Zn-ribbon protein
MEEKQKELQREADKVKERLDQLVAMENKIREKLDPNLLKRCDFLFEKRAGVAVAAVEGGVCQLCHLNIPPQKFIELQRDESILQCPHCLRFLYWSGHEAYKVVEEPEVFE